ncbi:MAG: CPBP family intramembrane metalloprotease [Bacteroidales bacterium]|nr:CPBP family intramembrane metalloprotease [Bacteroidales bacterium]MCF6341273.1 CPBP family intramembrane metalloprotease [Bacteroidales bacterium]
MKNEIKYILLLLLCFSLYFAADKTVFSKIYHAVENIIGVYPISYFIAYLVVGLPVLLFVFLTNGRCVLKPLGLNGNFLRGTGFAFACTLPMFIGYAILGDFAIRLDGQTFWFGVVFAAFFEEFYYRGFFFGQLFRNTKLGFLPALFLGALVFASLHLYQSNDPATLFGVFIITFMGAGFFAWLFVEWNYNLWVAVAMHFFMNLSWVSFSISDNAFGDLPANLIRGLTIVLAILGTLIIKKKQKVPLAINRKTLLRQNRRPE